MVEVYQPAVGWFQLTVGLLSLLVGGLLGAGTYPFRYRPSLHDTKRFVAATLLVTTGLTHTVVGLAVLCISADRPALIQPKEPHQ